MTEQERRDQEALEQGNRHAHPEIRSMYPSKSRGEMAREFAQLFTVGWNSAIAFLDGKSSSEANINDDVRELIEAAKFILEAKMSIDPATVPRQGIEMAPDQVVYEASISYARIKRLKQALEKLENDK